MEGAVPRFLLWLWLWFRFRLWLWFRLRQGTHTNRCTRCEAPSPGFEGLALRFRDERSSPAIIFLGCDNIMASLLKMDVYCILCLVYHSGELLSDRDAAIV